MNPTLKTVGIMALVAWGVFILIMRYKVVMDATNAVANMLPGKVEEYE